jgi:mannose-1-phosphate guanylyltransferase
MFIARASVFQAAFNKFAPQLTELAEKYHLPKELRLLYKTLSRISFDYAIMEPVSRNPKKEANHNITVDVVPGDFEWDDVGSLLSFDKYFPHDSNGNVCDGPSNTVESTNNICVSRGAKISLVGTSNLVVVTTPEYVLVADKSHVRNMKKLFIK